jgi:hypothetical protein
MEMFWVTFISLMAIVIGGYFVVTTGYKRMVAKQRSEHWVKHLTEIGTKMPYEDAPFELRHGEKYVLSLRDQMLVESRRGTRVSTRSTDAFTVALAKGFYYTAAAGQSVSPEPDDELKQIDTGVAHFTTHRVVFVGGKQTREWDFAKLLGTTEQPVVCAHDLGIKPSKDLRACKPECDPDISRHGLPNHRAGQGIRLRGSQRDSPACSPRSESAAERDAGELLHQRREIERRTEQWRKQNPLPDVEPVKKKKKASSPCRAGCRRG